MNDRRRTSYIHPIDIPRRRKQTEKVTRRPIFLWDVVAVTAMAWLTASFAFWGFTGDRQVGIGLGATMAFLVLLWRVWRVLDDPPVDIEEIEFQEVETMVQPRFALRNGEPFAVARRPKLVQFGNKQHTFSGRELDKMLSAQRAGKEKLTRTICNWSGDTYQVVQAVLRGRVLIDGDNNYTPAGVAWLEEE